MFYQVAVVPACNKCDKKSASALRRYAKYMKDKCQSAKVLRHIISIERIVAASAKC